MTKAPRLGLDIESWISELQNSRRSQKPKFDCNTRGQNIGIYNGKMKFK